MNNQKISSKDYQILLLKALLLLGFAWGGFILALVGFFYASIVWTISIIVGIWLVRNAIKKGVSFKPSREIFLATLSFIFVVHLFAFFSTPSVFTGRDQGSFAEAAVRLSQNHKLEFSTPSSEAFFKLHQPGRALNFPGFYYTPGGQLITQFSLVYISWLALFFSIFGTLGLTVANAVLLFAFLFSFYILTRMFLNKSSSIAVMLFMTTSFVFMWFSKFTLSENMALPLVWLSILSFMLFLKDQRRLFFMVFFLSAALLCFTRIEGLAFLLVSLLLLFFNKSTRNFIMSKPLARLVLPAVFIFIVFIANMITDIYFYKEIVKAILPSVSAPKAQYIGQLKNTALPSFYSLKIFYLYGLLGFFITGTIGMLVTFWKKEFYKLIPLFFVLPTFIYFFDSQITPDHPWMLRRFSFSILPVFIFYSGLLLGQLLEKKSSDEHGRKLRFLSGIIITILLAMNLPAFSKYLTFSENENLLKQTKSLSGQFKANDLVLMDRESAGDGWAMISGPMNSLYGKNSVYFFNTQDLSKLDMSAFDNVYLIASSGQAPFYLSSTIGNRLKFVNDYTLSTSKIDVEPANPLKKISFPEKMELVVDGKIFKIEK